MAEAVRDKSSSESASVGGEIDTREKETATTKVSLVLGDRVPSADVGSGVGKCDGSGVGKCDGWDVGDEVGAAETEAARAPVTTTAKLCESAYAKPFEMTTTEISSPTCKADAAIVVFSTLLYMSSCPAKSPSDAAPKLE